MTLMTIMITIMTSIKFKINDICRLFYTIIHTFYGLRSKQTVHGMSGPSDKALFFFFLTSGSLARLFFFFFLYLRYATTTTTKHSRPFGGTKKKKRTKESNYPLFFIFFISLIL